MSFMLGVLQEMDLLASPFAFLMQKRRRLQTYIGGIIMVMLCAIGITSLVIFSYRMYDFSEVSIISERSYDNTYEETILNSSNFMIALSLSKSGVKYSHNNTHFRPSVTAYTMTTDQDGMIETTSMKFSLVNCTPEHFERFPNEFKKLKADSSLLCLNETNFVLNGSYGLSTYQFLRINIERCTNSSTSQIVCATPENISNISRDLRVDIYFEDNGDQVTNSNNPFRQFLNLYSVALDPLLSRKTDLFMKKTRTKSDKGLFLRSDIEIEERMSYDYESTQIYTTDGISFLKVFYRLSPNRVMNHRTYWKFSDVLARTMGILQTAIIVGRLIAALYSRFKIYELLINSSFVYQSEKETQEKESAPVPPSHKDDEKEGKDKEFNLEHFFFDNYYKEVDRDEGEVLGIPQEEQRNNESPVRESKNIMINMVNVEFGVDSNEHRGDQIASPASASANLISNSLQTSRRPKSKSKWKATANAQSFTKKLEKKKTLAKDADDYVKWVLERKRFNRTKSLENDMIIRDDYINFNFGMVLFLSLIHI
eukprot:TRINITY_DN4586_c0_g1_i7.p1 TRINITY_DN4586_c0_g1~~TRINITY_DN4586_c0_g1_i7.p1  ORF type:complete len:539 (-),score=55.53 TRINITY_DN4586_c0_g1_i7:61-1677(-)